MNISGLAIGFLYLVVLVLGCGGPAPSGRLSTADVTGLPPGNAVGTSFSGTYTITQSTLLDCKCREGSCTNLHASVGARLVLSHTDGVLQMVEDNAEEKNVLYTGGIDRDGKFWAGNSHSSKVAWIVLMEGAVTAATSLDARTRGNLVGKLDGRDHDCDVEVKIHASGQTR